MCPGSRNVFGLRKKHFLVSKQQKVVSTTYVSHATKLGNIVSCYVSGLANLAGSKQNFLQPGSWKIKGHTYAYKLTSEEVLNPGSTNVFDLGRKHFLVSEQQKFPLQQCFRNNVS